MLKVRRVEEAMKSKIRLADAGCAEGIRAIYAPIVEDTVISFEATPPDAAEMARRMRGVLLSHPWLVCEGPGGIEGYAYGSTFSGRAAYDWTCEASVYVANDSRSAGVGRRLYRALLELLARQGYRQVCAGITLPNAASVGLHESFDFEPVAVYKKVGFKFGAWHDVGWWQRSLSSLGTPPDPLEDLGKVCAGFDWGAF